MSKSWSFTGSGGTYTGTVTMSTPITQTVSASTFKFSIPAHTIRATSPWLSASTARSYKVTYGVILASTGTQYAYGDVSSSRVANASTNASVSASTLSRTLNTSTFFSSSNPTVRTVPFTIRLNGGNIIVGSDIYDMGIDTTRIVDVATINLTLNAPPSFTSSQVSFDTSYVYTGLTTASVDVSSLSAQYGGSISEVKLTIGNQTATRTNNGTLSILLNTAGTFTPTVSVKDSRGQVTTKTLDVITVNGYTAPALSFSVQRSLASGVPNDEGGYGAISANLTFTDAIADLSQPTVEIDGVTASVTWYANRASDGTMSGTVDWSSLQSPATVYGIVSASNIQTSYQIAITPNDSISSGTPITQTLASAFYTIDFLAGGHGIAFGQPSSEEGFFCNMDAHFKDKTNLVRALFDFIHPVGSYYETSDTSFDPNNTWGGTWVLETAGQVHVSAGAGYSVSGALSNTSDGGSKDAIIPYHRHDVPSVNISSSGGHSHTVARYASSGTAGTGYTWDTTPTSVKYGLYAVTGNGAHTHSVPAHDTNYAGSSGNTTNANMQPYIVVNRWHRTA